MNKFLTIIAKIGFLFALISSSLVSGRHIYEVTEPKELNKYKGEE
ncbi:AgrD family cyclic lactone autoinducer peptide [Longibaculum muris]|nr:cyclic lactone autoinducer peptide [Longibaculum muris]